MDPFRPFVTLDGQGGARRSWNSSFAGTIAVPARPVRGRPLSAALASPVPSREFRSQTASRDGTSVVSSPRQDGRAGIIKLVARESVPSQSPAAPSATGSGRSLPGGVSIMLWTSLGGGGPEDACPE